jgi:N-acetylglucosamine kinase-like BadF-type ATPase
MKILAIDVGRTAVRAVIFADATRGPSVQLDSGATLADPDGPRRVVASVETVLRAFGEDATTGLSHVVVAAAGAVARPDHAGALAGELVARHFAAEVVVTTDVVAAHAGALAGKAGVVLAAGTGAVACAIDARGTITLVDGAGYLIGDAGSGYAVGRAGLDAAIRHHDGRPGASAGLALLAEEQFGPLGQLAGQLQGMPGHARAVASFAPAVARAARDGDQVALAIWHDAVCELADTALTAAWALPESDRRIAVTGSLFDLNDLVAEPFSATVASRDSGITVRRATGDAVLGASRLAGGPASGYESLLLRRPAAGPHSGIREASERATTVPVEAGPAPALSRTDSSTY